MTETNRYQHLANLAIEELNRRLPSDLLRKPLNERLHLIYESTLVSTSQGSTRDTTPAEVARVIQRGHVVDIPPQIRHRKEGGRRRNHK